ncbi:MAG: HlyD family efflux transporter periplasmic adaptor subunit [Balneolaceae bacterium]|nr:HlyD family efflux transporter periplasmic adaptor subunit [Balneolaceae bacterium]
MQIHANVSEADIGTVIEGQLVEFQVDAYRGRIFPGEVVQVRNAPQMEDNVVHYETIIAVNNDERLLKPGMTAEVSIITAQRHDVVRARNTALRARLPDSIRPEDPPSEEGMEGRVYLIDGERLVAKRVKTGLSDGVYTEIVEGLEPGDELAVGLSLRAGGEEERRSLFSGSQAQY